MNSFSALDSRNRRNLLAHSMNAFSPPFHKNYSTDTTTDMKTSFGDSLFINTIHLIPEPMKMNLADSVVTLNEKKLKTNMADTKVNNSFSTKKQQNTKGDYYPSLAGITNFFSGVLNVMGAMFQKRANSPVQYYDCYEQDFEDHQQMTPSSLAWQKAKYEDQNINGRAQTDEFADETCTEPSTDMNDDFRSIAAHCENKLNQVRLLLNNPQVQKTSRSRRPKRAFHEASCVEELFEDAFNPEDFINLANETFLEYCSPFNHHHEELQTVDAPKVKTETIPIKESMEFVQSVPPTVCSELKTNIPRDKIEDGADTDIKRQVVVSCEDKVSQLKALLKCKRSQKSSVNEAQVNTPTNKVDPQVTRPICIPNQSDTEVIFAKEIELAVTPESPCVLDPNSYFDEVTGRFYSSSATDSEDSFQIVFSDSPQNKRRRIPSDCESEDSFIVFEESPDSCYTSTDVFGDETIDATNISDSEDSDSDCGSDLDSGLSTIALSHSLTRTFGDLTDGSLYEDSKGEDVVDCAFQSGIEIPEELIDANKAIEVGTQDHSGATKRGLLLDDARKRERKKLPEKKVHFSPLPPKVHVMRVWAFAARQARAGHWERHALDRERFKRRIADVEVAVSWVLKPQHRSRVMFQRFMPWWNAQKRKELAEKKQKEIEEKQKLEKEKAERVAMEDEAGKLNGNDTLDLSEVNEKPIVHRPVDTKEFGGMFKNMQNDTVRSNQVNNEVTRVNCKEDSFFNSENLIKSDNAIVERTVENILEDKIRKGEATETISDGEFICNETGIKKVYNGDNNVRCKIDNVMEDNLIQRRQTLKKEIIDKSELKITDCDASNFVTHGRKMKTGDIT